MEADNFNNTGKLIQLSASNLVDCAWSERGCGWGNVITALSKYCKAYKVMSEADYPYHDNSAGVLIGCSYHKDKGIVKVK